MLGLQCFTMWVLHIAVVCYHRVIFPHNDVVAAFYSVMTLNLASFIMVTINPFAAVLVNVWVLSTMWLEIRCNVSKDLHLVALATFLTWLVLLWSCRFLQFAEFYSLMQAQVSIRLFLTMCDSLNASPTLRLLQKICYVVHLWAVIFS